MNEIPACAPRVRWPIGRISTRDADIYLDYAAMFGHRSRAFPTCETAKNRFIAASFIPMYEKGITHG